MSSVTPSQPAPPASARPAAQSRRTEAGEATGLFANLLALISDTRTLPETAQPPGEGKPHDSAHPQKDPATGSALQGQPSGWPTSRLGDALPSDPATPASAGAAPADQVSHAGVRLQGADEETTNLPPGMQLVKGHEAMDTDTATALAGTPQETSSQATERPTQAAPFLGTQNGRSNAVAGAAVTTTASLQTAQWRRGATAVAEDSRHQSSSTAAAGLADANALRQASGRAAVRSTVALHERFGSLPVAEGASGAAASTSTVGWVTGMTGTPAAEARSAGDAVAAGDGGADSASTEAHEGGLPEPFESAADRAAKAAEAEARQTSQWGAQSLRHASLRVGANAADAIDIRLSLSGQEVQVEFLTDDAQMRAQLQNSAGDMLAEPLQRSGIQLGGVSVGAQGQGPAHEHAAQTAVRSRTPESPARPDRSAPEQVGSQAATPRPRADGSQPLDVFA